MTRFRSSTLVARLFVVAAVNFTTICLSISVFAQNKPPPAAPDSSMAVLIAAGPASVVQDNTSESTWALKGSFVATFPRSWFYLGLGATHFFKFEHRQDGTPYKTSITMGGIELGPALVFERFALHTGLGIGIAAVTSRYVRDPSRWEQGSYEEDFEGALPATWVSIRFSAALGPLLLGIETQATVPTVAVFVGPTLGVNLPL